MKINYGTTLLKTSIIVLIFASFPILTALMISLILILTYRYVIALMLGLVAMPAMDIACYFGTKSNVNFMSATLFDKISYEKGKKKFTEMAKFLHKMTYKVEHVMGDMYYKPMDLKEAIDIAFVKWEGYPLKSEEDVN